ncbi:MAG: N-acetylneuraminate synthase family protein [Lachnospiraceae bacterium]|nr:N-acetylneuraminate synthase family protein [Lachnospiraceae bacterium]
MASCELRDGRIVGDYMRPYIIAEVNSSHNGNMDVAKQMIIAAKEAGCDCVKFQSWSAKSLYSKTYYKQNPIAKRFVDKFAMSPEQLKELAEYCRSYGIEFSSTPYSEEEVDFLVDIRAPFIKISSMELNNPGFLRYIARKGVPVVLSTGMGDMDEIEKAVKVIEEEGNRQIILLHCVSIYPAEETTINLNNIVGLREKFPDYPIGFSDHTLGDVVAVAATALGAAVIEKHLTLDKSKIGMDNQMAMEPADLKLLCDKCRMTQLAMGVKERVVLPKEYEQRNNMRRSIVATRDLAVGDIIQAEDLYAKRPGTGLAPELIPSLIGRKIVNAVEADTLINENDYI